MTVGNLSVKNPVFVNILMTTLLVLGIFSFMEMPREEFSEVPFFWAVITVPYPGAGAEDVEKQITVPIEDEMQGLENLDEIQSVSTAGVSTVQVRFQSSINKDRFDKLYQEVITRFNRADLPDGAEKETIDSFSSNDFNPVIDISVYGEVDYKTIIEISEKIQDEIKYVKDVSDVIMIGGRKKIISITADQNKLRSYSLSISDITSAVKSSNINIPAGSIDNGETEYLVRTAGEAAAVESFRNIVVKKSSDNKGTLYLENTADINEIFEEEKSFSRFNGIKSVTLRITKIPGGNSVSIVEDVKRIVSENRREVSSDVSFKFLNDSTVKINSSLDVLTNNALIGFILLVITLYFFIGLRNALITAVGIPVTFAITFIILNITGKTFNSNTLFALVLVLGMVVDHSIVIVENCYRFRQKGRTYEEAAIEGTDQVAVPVLSATLTTIAAFLPLMILPGTIGKFLRVIPLTAAIALAASTFEALFFLPSHYADWPGKKEGKAKEMRFKFSGKYKNFIYAVYEKRKTAASLFFALILVLFSLAGSLKQDLFSAEDYSVFYIDIEMAPGTSVKTTDKIVKEFEKKLIPLAGNGEVVSVSSFIGFLSTDRGSSGKGNTAQIMVELSSLKEGRKRPVSVIMGEAENLTRSIPGAENIFFRKATNGPPQDSPLNITITGSSIESLEKTVLFIRDRLKNYPELLNIEDDLSGGAPELKISINNERAASYGLDVLSAGLYIRAFIDGIKTDTILIDNKPVDIIVRYDNKSIKGAVDLDQMSVPSSLTGERIPFSAFAEIITDSSINAIKRIDGKRTASVSSGAYSKEKIPEITQAVIKEAETEFSLVYSDLEIKSGGEFEEFRDLLQKIAQIFLIALFLVYMILGTQFKSYTQPFLILFSVPAGFAGIILYLFVSGTPFSTTVMYGAVALAGIAVNDSIVLVSFINELRKNGRSIKEAVTEAADTRLRPILLTSLTTIAGLLPTAAGIGGKSVIWQPMANTIIFGLVFSTASALILIPALYAVFYDRKKIKQN
ncbi:MAG: efflux RND transporter permease subunit [Spirochaetia bacterium]|jgi:multidrug efflux pump subunit AcrB|nr:efflux RND transporter permease subunit [Spirochaetia bacterium]